MKSTQVFLVFVTIVFGLSAQNLLAAAKCSDANSPLAAMIRSGTDAPSKIPLILIHGIQSTPDGANVEVDNKIWVEFIKLFNAKDSDLSGRYALYLFQYCSDREPVSKIAERLRDLIDQKIPGRQHVIVAHSMGGLVAKSYIGETEHTKGVWKGKKGGETITGIITLATPHHGTPGANDPVTMKRFVPDKFEAIYNGVQQYYWRSEKGSSGPSVRSPSAPNRSDLRWDNYDLKLEVSSKDINADLARSNRAFEPYASKLIAYGGTAASTLSAFETGAMLLETRLGGKLNEHRLLALANIGLVNGLGRHFGDADGLVPLISSLFCKAEATVGERSANYICKSTSRVRRFESGSGGEQAASQLPDKDTLSIFRTSRGFNHLDMLTNADVFKYLVKDLAALLPITTRQTPTTIKPSKSGRP